MKTVAPNNVPLPRSVDWIGSELESVITGLMRLTGRPQPEPASPPSVEFESARAFGDVWALTELWNSLGFGQLRRIFGGVIPPEISGS